MMFEIFKGKTISLSNPTVLLSHSSKNKNYGDLIRDLLVSCGVPNDMLLYSSHKMNEIPVGNNIFDYLEKTIKVKKHAVFLLSDDYFESTACLNEMGAIWLNQNQYTQLFLPDFDLKHHSYLSCCINSKDKGIFLTGDDRCQKGLTDFVRNILRDSFLSFNETELAYNAEICCKNLRDLILRDKVWKSRISEITENKGYVFAKIENLIPTGEVFKEGENHWLQLNTNYFPEAELMKVGDRIAFKVKDFTECKSFQELKNYRNIYAYRETLEIID